jgi:hypothetical protein
MPGHAVQGHSLEDGIFTCDRISIGSGCAVGTGAFVHYAVTMEDGALAETISDDELDPGLSMLADAVTRAAA